MNHLRHILPYLPDIGPPKLREKLASIIPHEGIQEAKQFVDTIYRLSINIYREKVRALELGDETVARQVGEGKDIMSILSSSPFSPYISCLHRANRLWLPQCGRT